MTTLEQVPQPRAVGGCSPLRGQARERAILDATVELVAEIGYDGVTVDAIAARAKASKATIYRKWPGKAELVAAALICHAEEGKAELLDTGSLRTDLLSAVDGMSCSFAGDDGPSLVSLVEIMRADATVRDLIASQVDIRSQVVADIMCSRAIERGEQVNVANSKNVLELAFAKLFTVTLMTGAGPDEETQRALVDDVLLPLLGATTPSKAALG